MGDVLWIEPVIRQIAKKYKKIIVFTKYAELFNNYPLQQVVFKNQISIPEKILYRTESLLNTRMFSINLDMSYEKDPHKHILHAYQQKAGVPLTTEYPILHLDQEEQTPLPGLAQKYMVLHLESLAPRNYRRVYGINWEKIVQYINGLGYAVILVGKDPEMIPGAEFRKTSIREMIRLIRHAAFFIGIDSGPSHIAASLTIPSLVFFGAVNPLYRHFPELFNGFFLQQPCEYANCYHDTRSIHGPTCKLVGNDGTPKCSLHTNEYLLLHINLLLDRYVRIH